MNCLARYSFREGVGKVRGTIAAAGGYPGNQQGGQSMRPIMLVASLAAMALGSSSGALAQRIGIEIDEPNYYYGYGEPAPRVHRYRGDAFVPAIPIRPASCGEFRYWNGDRCVDARVVPPDLR